MDMLLSRNVAVGAAGVLNVNLPAQHLPDRFRLWAGNGEDLYREHHGIATRIVVEHHLDGSVGVEPAVPIRIAVDAYRGESRRQCAGGEHVIERDRKIA